MVNLGGLQLSVQDQEHPPRSSIFPEGSVMRLNLRKTLEPPKNRLWFHFPARRGLQNPQNNTERLVPWLGFGHFPSIVQSGLVLSPCSQLAVLASAYSVAPVPA